MFPDYEMEWIERERTAVYRIANAAMSATTIADFFNYIYKLLKEYLDIQNFYVALYDEHTDLISFPFYMDEMEAAPVPYKPGRGLTEYVLRSGQPQLITPDEFDRLVQLGEVELVGADGIDWIGVPLALDGKVSGVMATQTYHHSERLSVNELKFLDYVSTEISMVIAQKKIEETLRQEEVKYRTLFEVSTDAVFLETLKGEILDCNENACILYGYPKNELLEKTVFDLIPDEIGLEMPSYIDMEINQGGFMIEAVGKRKDGTLFPTEVKTKLVHLDQKPVVVAFITDISLRKQHQLEVEAIASMAKALKTAVSFSEVLDILLEQVVRLVKAGGAGFYLKDELTGDAVKVGAKGQGEATIGRRIPAGMGVSGYAMSTGNIYVTNDLQADEKMYFRDNIAGMNSLVSMPLAVEDKIIGCLQIAKVNPFLDDELQMLNAVSDMAASAIHRAYLYQKGEDQSRELTEAYEATLMGWSEAMELRDRETRGHSTRVVEKSMQLAKRLNIPEDNITQLRRGSLLHDIGKMGVPDSILLKPGPLSDDEWRTMKKHPVMAFQMLAGVPYLKQALDVPLYHHERWDGKGYPYGLKEKQIPILARIFAVVDVWDALTTNRPYRPGWSQEETLEYIEQQSGKHFDPDVVREFITMMKLNASEEDLGD